MRATFTLGRIAGVRVGVHWSILIIFTLIALGLAEGRLPDAYPGRSWWSYWLIGLITAAVFFASLLAHELAHAVVARRNNVAVDDIVLWLLGGVARLRSEASTPAAELRIAGVGPLVSLCLGGCFALAAWLVDSAVGPGLASEALVWLAVINLLLAVFNSVAGRSAGRRTAPARVPVVADRGPGAGDRRSGGGGPRVRLVPSPGGSAAVRAGRCGRWAVAGDDRLVPDRRGDRRGAAGRTSGRAPRCPGAPDHDVRAGHRARRAECRGVSGRSSISLPPFRFPRHRRRRSLSEGLVTLKTAGRVPEEQREAVRVREVMIPLSQVVVVGPDDQLVELLPRMSAAAGQRALVVDEGGTVVGIVASSDISRTMSWLMTATPQGHRHSGSGPADTT